MDMRRAIVFSLFNAALVSAQFGGFGSNGPPSGGFGGPRSDSNGNTVAPSGGSSSSGPMGGSQASSQPSGPQLIEMEFGRSMTIAHGVLASLAIVIFFPAGAITIRLIPSKLALWLHVAWQITGYVLFVAAFGIGVWMAPKINFGSFHLINQYHPVIGILVFAFLSLQPFLGVLHHVFFKRYSKRTLWSHAHLWIGRIFITLGIINGGLGLRLADNATSGQEIAYGVLAGVIWLVWIGAAVFGEFKRLKSRSRDPPPAYEYAIPSGGEIQEARYFNTPEPPREVDETTHPAHRDSYYAKELPS